MHCENLPKQRARLQFSPYRLRQSPPCRESNLGRLRSLFPWTLTARTSRYLFFLTCPTVLPHRPPFAPSMRGCVWLIAGTKWHIFVDFRPKHFGHWLVGSRLFEQNGRTFGSTPHPHPLPRSKQHQSERQDLYPKITCTECCFSSSRKQVQCSKSMLTVAGCSIVCSVFNWEEYYLPLWRTIQGLPGSKQGVPRYVACGFMITCCVTNIITWFVFSSCLLDGLTVFVKDSTRSIVLRARHCAGEISIFVKFSSAHVTLTPLHCMIMLAIWPRKAQSYCSSPSQ